jgi:hypothetical protein
MVATSTVESDVRCNYSARLLRISGGLSRRTTASASQVHARLPKEESHMRTRIVVVVVLGLLSCSVPARAQAQRTYWGVSGEVEPVWQVPSSFKVLFDADSLTFKGSEYSIGFVRGSILGGDWGVSFVHKTVSDNSNVTRLLSSQCAGCGNYFTTSGASFTGVEVHRFVPFGTIKQRVQIGMNFAGGVAELNGTVHELSVSPTGAVSQNVDASTLFAPGGHQIKVIPLAKIEFAVAGILGPDLKIRAGGGFDFPGYNKFNIAVVYFFGAR